MWARRACLGDVLSWTGWPKASPDHPRCCDVANRLEAPSTRCRKASMARFTVHGRARSFSIVIGLRAIVVSKTRLA
jgi:hypothetical protein